METSNSNQPTKAIRPRWSGLVNKVQPIYDYTVKFLDLLENKPDMDRNEKIQLINHFLEKREKSISTLSAPYNDQEMKLGQKLVDLNQKIDHLLNQEKLLIQKDINGLNAKKIFNQKYSNPYEGFSTGGVFYDKRN
jgi:flagellar protein FliT